MGKLDIASFPPRAREICEMVYPDYDKIPEFMRPDEEELKLVIKSIDPSAFNDVTKTLHKLNEAPNIVTNVTHLDNALNDLSITLDKKLRPSFIETLGVFDNHNDTLDDPVFMLSDDVKKETEKSIKHNDEALIIMTKPVEDRENTCNFKITTSDFIWDTNIDETPGNSLIISDPSLDDTTKFIVSDSNAQMTSNSDTDRGSDQSVRVNIDEFKVDDIDIHEYTRDEIKKITNYEEIMKTDNKKTNKIYKIAKNELKQKKEENNKITKKILNHIMDNTDETTEECIINPDNIYGSDYVIARDIFKEHYDKLITYMNTNREILNSIFHKPKLGVDNVNSCEIYAAKETKILVDLKILLNKLSVFDIFHKDNSVNGVSTLGVVIDNKASNYKFDLLDMKTKLIAYTTIENMEYIFEDPVTSRLFKQCRYNLATDLYENALYEFFEDNRNMISIAEISTCVPSNVQKLMHWYINMSFIRYLSKIYVRVSMCKSLSLEPEMDKIINGSFTRILLSESMQNLKVYVDEAPESIETLRDKSYVFQLKNEVVLDANNRTIIIPNLSSQTLLIMIEHYKIRNEMYIGAFLNSMKMLLNSKVSKEIYNKLTGTPIDILEQLDLVAIKDRQFITLGYANICKVTHSFRSIAYRVIGRTFDDNPFTVVPMLITTFASLASLIFLIATNVSK